MFLNNASLPYQHLVDSQAESYKKSKLLDDYRQNIVNLENTIKTKDEHIAYLEQNIINHENTLKTKDEHIERINNSLINLSGGRMAQFVRAPQFVPHGPQVIARTIPLLIVPKAIAPSVPKAFQHRTSRSSPYKKDEHYS